MLETYKFGCLTNEVERNYIKETMIEFVKTEPTAYDVEKVVAELEELEQSRLEMYDWQGQSATSDAIDIVKRGGVDGNI